MAGRRRRFSTVSVDETLDRVERIEYIPEKSALKSIPEALRGNADNWPCYVLEDATVYLTNGKTIGNLLHSELQGPFIVRGKLIVDGDLRRCLANKKYNGQYIEVSNCQGFSIGSGPITVWAMGSVGWFEVQPSESYQKTYDRMTDAIFIYYFVMDLYEHMREMSRRGSKRTLSIDQILLKYAQNEGTGLIRSEAAERIKGHAEFLLSQMLKGESITWKNTVFFKWLSAECHAIYKRFPQTTGETLSLPSPIGFVTLPTPILLRQPERKQQKLPSHSSISTPPNPPSSRSSSSLAPRAPKDPSSPLAIILHTMHEADTSNHCPRSRMTLSKLGTILYYAYNIKTYPLSREIVRLHAKSIISSLTAEWKSTPIYAQLSAIASEPVTKSDLRTQAINTTEMVKRRVASTFRRVNSSTAASTSNGRSQRPSRQQPTPRLHSPEPHASKSLLPPQSGRRSGKEAGLRLASSPAVKHDALDRDNSPVFEGNTFRSRKRRRVSPPEMGEDSDTDMASFPIEAGSEVVGADIDQGLDLNLNLRPAPIPSIKLVVQALPTLSGSGPNGAWICSVELCSFVVRDPESEEGKEQIREHFNAHADRLERETLVRKEAAQRRLPIDHLLEKLRSIGESARSEQEAGLGVQMIGGRVVPQPIKRSSSIAC